MRETRSSYDAKKKKQTFIAVANITLQNNIVGESLRVAPKLRPFFPTLSEQSWRGDRLISSVGPAKVERGARTVFFTLNLSAPIVVDAYFDILVLERLNNN